MGFADWHVVHHDSDVQTLAHLTHLEGSLIVRDNSDVSAISLPRLSSISGHLDVGGERLESLELPRLRTVGAQLVVTASRLREVTLPALENIGKALEVSNNPNLLAIRCLLLQRVGASLIVEDNLRLQALSFPRLVHVALDCIESGNPSLDSAVWLTLREQSRQGRR